MARTISITVLDTIMINDADTPSRHLSDLRRRRNIRFLFFSFFFIFLSFLRKFKHFIARKAVFFSTQEFQTFRSSFLFSGK